MLKSSFGLLYVNPIKQPVDNTSRVISAFTGDDAMRIYFLRLPREWFTDKRAFIGKSTGTMARKLILFRLEMVGDKIVWTVKELARDIPKLARAMSCMRRTIAYAPGQSQDRIHPILVLKNFLRDEARQYWPEMKEFLSGFANIDLSLFWLWYGEPAEPEQAVYYAQQNIDVIALQKLSQQIDRIPHGKEESLGSNLQLISCNNSVVTAWRLYANALLMTSFTAPTPREEKHFISYEELEKMRVMNNKIKKDNVSPNGDVPVAFLTTYARIQMRKGKSMDTSPVLSQALPCYRLLKQQGLLADLKGIMFENTIMTEKEIDEFVDKI